MDKILLSPPVAFTIILVVILLFSHIGKLMAAKGTASAGKLESYASGEDIKLHKVQPDYRQFFPFAFFFTIMHVVALIVATVPSAISPMAFVYILAALLALLILLRK